MLFFKFFTDELKKKLRALLDYLVENNTVFTCFTISIFDDRIEFETLPS